MLFCGLPLWAPNPDTQTYTVAASTTVMATMRMTAMTGETASSAFWNFWLAFIGSLEPNVPSGGHKGAGQGGKTTKDLRHRGLGPRPVQVRPRAPGEGEPIAGRPSSRPRSAAGAPPR